MALLNAAHLVLCSIDSDIDSINIDLIVRDPQPTPPNMRALAILTWTATLSATACAQALMDPNPVGNQMLIQADSPLKVYTCPHPYNNGHLCCPGTFAVQCKHGKKRLDTETPGMVLTKDTAAEGEPGVTYDPEGPPPPSYCETGNPFCCGQQPQRMDMVSFFGFSSQDRPALRTSIAETDSAAGRHLQSLLRPRLPDVPYIVLSPGARSALASK